MAMAAYQRARALSPGNAQGDHLYGLGCTAALTTNRQRKGSDRCYISIQSSRLTLTVSLELDPMMNRITQEQQCQQAILLAMAHATGLTDQLEADNCIYQLEVAPDSWQRLMSGKSQSTLSGNEDLPRLVFPGAFNPYHEGHRQMTRLAERIAQESVFLEISTHNVDKPPLDFIDMSSRIKNLGNTAVVFTNAPTFSDKSTLFPGATFVVGVDTITRIADSQYYDHSIKKRDQAIDALVANKHHFLVFGRKTGTAYQSLKTVNIPETLLDICREVPESDFRNDISSTEIRASADEPTRV
jgi:nicotinic acid mononucleotide adenylyltransferase